MSDLLAGRTARWLLLGSLALNLALGVALLLPATGLIGGDARHHERGGHRMATPWMLRGVLSPERREAIEPIMQRHREPLRGAIRATRQARRAVDAELRNESFDRAAFERALVAMRERDQATVEALHAMLTDAIEQLDAGERNALADRLWRRNREARQERQRLREERRERREQLLREHRKQP